MTSKSKSHHTVVPLTRRDLLASAAAAGGALLGARLLAAPSQPHASNGDEGRYDSRFASFSKGLPHNRLGEVDRRAYDAMVKSIAEDDRENLDTVARADVARFVNPQASFATSVAGLNLRKFTVPTPPAFDSAEQASEAAELYWQALTLDIPFRDYASDPLIAAAAADLSRCTRFAGPRSGGTVTAGTLFRGTAPGDLTGPYVSQFLWKEVPYGPTPFAQTIRCLPEEMFLVQFDDWLAVQNGGVVRPPEMEQSRHILTARDLAAYVRSDFTYQAFLNAALILLGMQGTTDLTKVYRGAPYDAANPYKKSKNQSGFVTFGSGHILDLVARVSAEALKASWYVKWVVHRRLRPEEFGGRVHNHLTKRARYPLHEEVLASAALEETYKRHGSYLLPVAYPEGAPLHPSYPSGHAVIAGAAVTVLKAFFDENFPIYEPVVPTADGAALEPYRAKLKVGDELNKLASNIAFARNGAGIHWRSDATAGLQLGEAVALAALKHDRTLCPERFAGFEVTLFDGTVVRAT